MKGFSDIIKGFLNIEAHEQTKRFKLLADEFEVALSTIERWALGIAKPHPKIQKLIVMFIEKWKE